MKLAARTVKSIRMHYSLFGLGGVLRRVACTLPFSIPISRERVVVRLDTTDVATFEQAFINHEYRFELQHDPKLIVDAGANVGMSSVFFQSITHKQKWISKVLNLNCLMNLPHGLTRLHLSVRNYTIDFAQDVQRFSKLRRQIFQSDGDKAN